MTKAALPTTFGKSTKPKLELSQLERLHQEVTDVMGQVSEAQMILYDAGNALRKLAVELGEMRVKELRTKLEEFKQ